MTIETPADQVQWAQGLLERMGRNPQGSNLVGVTAWALAEGGHWANDAKYNPLNTTWETPDSRDINSVGVKAYSSWDEGYSATISTLELHYYTGVVSALSSVDPYALAKAVGASPWGTGDFSAAIPRAVAMVAGERPAQPPTGQGGSPAPRPTEAPKWPGREMMLRNPYMEGSDVHQWQTRMWQRGWTKIPDEGVSNAKPGSEFVVDGVYGPNTASVCKAFQKQKDLSVDGIVGPQTWAAAWTAPITIP